MLPVLTIKVKNKKAKNKIIQKCNQNTEWTWSPPQELSAKHAETDVWINQHAGDSDLAWLTFKFDKLFKWNKTSQIRPGNYYPPVNLTNEVYRGRYDLPYPEEQFSKRLLGHLGWTTQIVIQGRVHHAGVHRIHRHGVCSDQQLLLQVVGEQQQGQFTLSICSMGTIA